jgi:hypothetical protein
LATVVCLALGVSGTAVAQPTIGFTASSGNQAGQAGWVSGVDAPGDTDGQAIRLSISAPPGEAEVVLGNVGSTPPSSPPSFMFASSQSFDLFTGGTWAQVELHFSDGITVSAGANPSSPPWSAGVWTLMGGTATPWIATLGDMQICPGVPRGPTYEQAIACPLSDGATFTGADVYLYSYAPTPDVYVDDLSFGGTTFTTGPPLTTSHPVTTGPLVTGSPPETSSPPSGGGVGPSLSALRVSPGRVSLAGRVVNGHCVKPTKQNSSHKRCQRPIKLKVSYTLSGLASVTFTIERPAPGRNVGGRCVKPTSKNTGHKRCTRLTGVPGKIPKTGVQGANSFTFAGRIGGKSLAPGSYQLIATPTAHGASGPAQKVGFTIVG